MVIVVFRVTNNKNGGFMIERINERLLLWAEQVTTAGFSGSMSPIARLITNGGVVTQPRGGSVVLMSLEACAVERAVLQLPLNLIEAVKMFYLRGNLSPHQRAKKLSCSVRTMYRRIDTAHVLLDAALYGAVLPRVS